MENTALTHRLRQLTSPLLIERLSLPIALLSVPIALLSLPIAMLTAPAICLGEDTVQKLPEVVVEAAPVEHVPAAQTIEHSELQSKPLTGLGAALGSELGISSTGFGPGASRPVLRGLGDERVKILENGIGTQDVSSASPDHLVTMEPLLLDSVEVIRGPQTLMYGTSVIGGIVNTNDQRIPDTIPDGGASGRVTGRTGSNNEELSGAASVNSSIGNFVLHLDGAKRDTGDIRIPRDEALDTGRRLPSSFVDSDTATIGSSYIFDQGMFGVALSELNSNYGVPGEDNVSIDAKRRRVDLKGAIDSPLPGIENAAVTFGAVRYRHTEFEGEETGTKFKNNGWEGRLDFKQERLEKLHGMFGAQFQSARFSALGEEAFQPPTETLVASAFIFEEYDLSSTVRFQGGARLEYSDISAEASEGILERPRSVTLPTLSESVGVIWTPLSDYETSLTLSNTARAPSGQELFANGPHAATSAFEVGDPNLDPEHSIGVDLKVSKTAGLFTGSVGAFYNRFNNYIALLPSGDLRDDLPLYFFRGINADFWGFEGRVALSLFKGNGSEILTDVQLDYVQAEDRDNGANLPRITPMRTKAGLNFKNPDLCNFRIEVQHVFRQGQVSEFESATGSYTFLNARISREFEIESSKAELYLAGENLTDELARNHVSFIKDAAPLQGLNVILGMSLAF